jgi:hypothetical protein
LKANERSTFHGDEDKRAQGSEDVPVDFDTTQFAAEAVAEIMVSADLQVEPEEALTIAKERCSVRVDFR